MIPKGSTSCTCSARADCKHSEAQGEGGAMMHHPATHGWHDNDLTTHPSGIVIPVHEAREIRRAAKAAEPFSDYASITAPDDGMVRTHDDAQSMLRYAVPGAHVEFWRPATASAKDKTRAYSITIRRDCGQHVEPVRGSYMLPASAEALTRHAVEHTRKATEGTAR